MDFTWRRRYTDICNHRNRYTDTDSPIRAQYNVGCIYRSHCRQRVHILRDGDRASGIQRRTDERGWNFWDNLYTSTSSHGLCTLEQIGKLYHSSVVGCKRRDIVHDRRHRSPRDTLHGSDWNIIPNHQSCRKHAVSYKRNVQYRARKYERHGCSGDTRCNDDATKRTNERRGNRDWSKYGDRYVDSAERNNHIVQRDIITGIYYDDTDSHVRRLIHRSDCLDRIHIHGRGECRRGVERCL